MVAAACRAAALDSCERALASGACQRAILAVDSASGLDQLPAGVLLDVDDKPFHFGRRLAHIIQRCGLEAVVYLGGGALPLLSNDEFVGLARGLASGERIAITNNYYSSDLVAFRPASALARIRHPDSDNQLARTLAEEAAFKVHALPRSLSTTFDIDSPTDLAVLALSGRLEPSARLRRLLDSLPLDLARYRAVLPLFTDPRAQVVVAGRVGSHVWQHLERETACRVRLFAEERGLQADGRLEAGEARSLLGFYLAEVGVDRFFAALAQLGDAAFIDSRVLLAHLSASGGSRRDRFLSDLGQPEEIEEPFLRRFTEAALAAPLPVLLGGHSLVSGGLMALIELAWQEHDRALGAKSVDAFLP